MRMESTDRNEVFWLDAEANADSRSDTVSSSSCCCRSVSLHDPDDALAASGAIAKALTTTIFSNSNKKISLFEKHRNTGTGLDFRRTHAEAGSYPWAWNL